MRLSSIKPGSTVFIDANIFIYHFTGTSEECSAFLGRCENGELTGVTSANAILEVLHRLMMVEAVNKGYASPPNVVQKLQKQPHVVKRMIDYFTNARKIEQMGIAVEPFSAMTILNSHPIRLRYGLLINDSLVVAVMAERGIHYLATNDRGFSKVEGISVFSPGDIA